MKIRDLNEELTGTKYNTYNMGYRLQFIVIRRVSSYAATAYLFKDFDFPITETNALLYHIQYIEIVLNVKPAL